MKTTTRANIDTELYQQIKEYCKNHQLTITRFIHLACIHELERRRK